MAEDQGQGKAYWYALTEGMYVQDLRDHKACAEAAGVTERTIRTWAAEGDWAGKRSRRLANESETREKISRLVNAMVDDTTAAYERPAEGEEKKKGPSQAQLYALGKMVELMLKMQRYEKTEQEMPKTATAPDKTAAAERLEAASDEIQKTLAQLGLLR